MANKEETLINEYFTKTWNCTKIGSTSLCKQAFISTVYYGKYPDGKEFKEDTDIEICLKYLYGQYKKYAEYQASIMKDREKKYQKAPESLEQFLQDDKYHQDFGSVNMGNSFSDWYLYSIEDGEIK